MIEHPKKSERMAERQIENQERERRFEESVTRHINEIDATIQAGANLPLTYEFPINSQDVAAEVARRYRAEGWDVLDKCTYGFVATRSGMTTDSVIVLS